MGVASLSVFGGNFVLAKVRRGLISVHCSEFRGGRFSEVASILQVWDFQSVTRTLSALGSVSVSRSVCSGRFYCISIALLHLKCHSTELPIRVGLCKRVKYS